MPRDLPGTGSKTFARGVSDITRWLVLRLLRSRSRASRTPTGTGAAADLFFRRDDPFAINLFLYPRSVAQMTHAGVRANG